MRTGHYIDLELERTKARVRINDLVTGLLWLLAAVALYLLLAIVIDQLWPLGRGARVTMLIVMGILATAGLAAILLWPTIRRVNDLYAARLLERQADDQFRNSLVSYVQLRDDPAVADDVRAAVADKAAHDLDVIDVELAVDRRPLVAAGVVLAVVIVLFGCFAIVTPKSFAASFGRAVGFDLAAPTSTRILRLQPPDGERVMAGETVRLVADIGGTQPDAVTVRISFDGRQWDTKPMKPLGRGEWEMLVGNLLDDLHFSVTAGDARSGDHRIIVQPLPAIKQVQARLTYPAYTGLPTVTLPTGNVEAPPGTRVEVLAEMNQPARQPQLVFGDGSRRLAMSLAAGGTQARAEFTVEKDDSYHVQFHDQSQRYTNASAVSYQVKPVADQAPQVELSPTGQVEVAAGGAVELAVKAGDDFGLASLAVCWQTLKAAGGAVGAAGQADNAEASRVGQAENVEAGAAGLGAVQKIELPLKVGGGVGAAGGAGARDGKESGRPALLATEKVRLEPGRMGLKVGDVALVYAAATDRRPPVPQEGRSATLRLVVVEAAGQKTADGQGGQGGGGGGSKGENQTAGGGGQPAKSGQSGGAGQSGQSGQPSGAAGENGGGASDKVAGLSDRERGELEKLQQAIDKAGRDGGGSQSGGSADNGSQSSAKSPGAATSSPTANSAEKPPAESGTRSGGASGTGPGGASAARSDRGAGPEAASSSGSPSTGPPAAGSAGSAGTEGGVPGPGTPDAGTAERLGSFTESGQAGRGPERDSRLLQTIGPKIHRLAQELRAGTVDPKLLQELGWTENELRNFVGRYEERLGQFAGGAGSGAGGVEVVTRPSGPAITTAAGGAGRVGGGAASSERRPDDLQENIEQQQRRVSSRFATLVEEYLKAVSEAETSDGPNAGKETSGGGANPGPKPAAK